MYRTHSGSDSDEEKHRFSYHPKNGHRSHPGYSPPGGRGHLSPMPPPMTPAPASYHQSLPYASVPGPKGRKWRADFKDWLAFGSALAILFAWLGGAAYLTAVKQVLPLDYWGPQHFNGTLNNGNYNTLITVAGSLAGAVITWAVGQGGPRPRRLEGWS